MAPKHDHPDDVLERFPETTASDNKLADLLSRVESLEEAEGKRIEKKNKLAIIAHCQSEVNAALLMGQSFGLKGKAYTAGTPEEARAELTTARSAPIWSIRAREASGSVMSAAA